MQEIDLEDGGRGKPHVRWSDIIQAQAIIAKAKTPEKLGVALRSACRDIVGAAGAVLVSPEKGGAPRTEKALGEMRFWTGRDATDLHKSSDTPGPRNMGLRHCEGKNMPAMVNVGKSIVSMPIGNRASPIMLKVFWNELGHPSENEMALLEILADASIPALLKFDGACSFPVIDHTRNAVAESAAIAEPEDVQSQKMEALGRMAATLIHDINNLLSPIMASLELISRSEEQNHHVQQHLDVAMQAASTAQVLLRRLLQFSRNQPEVTETITPSSMLNNMKGLLSLTAGPAIKLQIIAPPGLPNIIGDQKVLEVALLNLVANARDAVSLSGDIIIGAERAEALATQIGPRRSFVRLFVKDNGCGMDEATKSRAFEPFYTTKALGSGTGLGLPMVRDMVERVGGKVEIDSTPGVGTEISIWMPGVPTPAVSEAINTGQVQLSTGRTLAFVIDDHGLVRKGTASMLREDGYHVVEFDSAEACLAQIEQGTIPDLIVSDHLMPDMNGLVFANHVRDIRPGIPFLLVSAFDGTEQLPKEIVRIAKPFRYHELRAGVSAARKRAHLPDAALRPPSHRSVG